MDVNKWFLSLPPERQAMLREDKWMLANAAAQAATEAEREACATICDTKGAIKYAGLTIGEQCATAIRKRSNV
jgi:hypothetical protein